jgi:flagellar basal body-associated protein FliL
MENEGYKDAMLTILLIVLLVLLVTGGIGFSRRGRRL